LIQHEHSHLCDGSDRKALLHHIGLRAFTFGLHPVCDHAVEGCTHGCIFSQTRHNSCPMTGSALNAASRKPYHSAGCCRALHPKRLQRCLRTRVSQMPGACMLDKQAAAAVLDSIDTLILDCDGVLWQGSDVVPGAPEVRRMGGVNAPPLACVGPACWWTNPGYHGA
jgi:hypothetical protein